MLLKLLMQWAVTAVGLALAAWIVPGISVGSNDAWVAVAVMALILSLVNAVVRPILTFLSCGCVVLTFGLFLFVINAFTLWLSSEIAQGWFSVDFVVDGFWAAVLRSIVVTIVSLVLTRLLPEPGRR